MLATRRRYDESEEDLSSFYDSDEKSEEEALNDDDAVAAQVEEQVEDDADDEIDQPARDDAPSDTRPLLQRSTLQRITSYGAINDSFMNLQQMSITSSAALQATTDYQSLYPTLPTLPDALVIPYDSRLYAPIVSVEQGESVKIRSTHVDHELTADDSLMSLALKYGTAVESIRMANQIFADTLDFFRLDHTSIVIPFPTQLPDRSSAQSVDVDAAQAAAREQARREMAVALFRKTRGVTETEARYYLSLYEYNVDRAVREYESDMAWERQQKVAVEQQQQRQRKERLRQILRRLLPKRLSQHLSRIFLGIES